MIRWWEYLQTARAFKGADIAERTAIVEQRLASLRRSDAIRILAQAAIDGSPQVRRAAIRALANFNQPAATQLLAGAVLDEDLDVARAAAAALLARDWQPQKPLQQRRMHIAHLIQQSDQGVGEERRQALLALARIDDPLASCHAPEAVVRQVAEEAAPSSIGFLMQAARSHGQIAGAVAQGLERIVKKYRRQLPDGGRGRSCPNAIPRQTPHQLQGDSRRRPAGIGPASRRRGRSQEVLLPRLQLSVEG
jgi:hypothetical protein